MKIKLVGGGGGGAGSSQNANNGGSGSSGGDTIFGSTSIGGGNGSSGGIGGFGSGCTSFSGVSSGFGINGQDGGQATVIAATTNAWTPPVFGGSSPFGLYGSGGSGAPGANESGVTQSINGGGGGASCYGEIIITSPTSTYSYSVGVAGIGGTAGTAGSPGRDGGQGFIFIEAHFQ